MIELAKPRGWRTADSYKSETPSKRLNQLLNLRQTKGGWKPIIAERKKLQEMNIIEFAEGKDYLNISFAKRPAQKVVLKALYGLPLDKEELKIFNILTKNKGKYRPGTELLELIACLGARSGKSFLVSIVALYEGTRDRWKKYVAKGENPYIVIIATRQKQAEAIIQTNCSRMLSDSPILKKMIKDTFQTELTLINGVKILSLPCNSTAGRGLPICVFILDEIAFYRIEGVKADEVIFNSLRPRQAQFPTCKMLMISTAGSKQGLFFSTFDQGFRIQDRLTIQGTTEFCNPVIPREFLDKEKSRDIDNFNREFQAEFSEKIESFFPYELIERPFTLAGDIKYKSGNIYYMGFDQSGLSGKDRFSMTIGHSEKETVIIDIVRSWTTKDLESIINDIKELKNEYHINKALVDKYAIGYVRNSFKKINLEIETRAGLPEIYVIMKSLIMKDKLNLPDRADLKAGMRNTLAIYSKSNSLSIYHERGSEGHADELDSCCTCISAIMQKLGGSGVRCRWISNDEEEEEEDSGKWQSVEGSNESNLLPEKYHQI
ncbi:hypothetical protein ES705_20509 [subsurface metagenome]